MLTGINLSAALVGLSFSVVRDIPDFNTQLDRPPPPFSSRTSHHNTSIPLSERVLSDGAISYVLSPTSSTIGTGVADHLVTSDGRYIFYTRVSTSGPESGATNKPQAYSVGVNFYDRQNGRTGSFKFPEPLEGESQLSLFNPGSLAGISKLKINDYAEFGSGGIILDLNVPGQNGQSARMIALSSVSSPTVKYIGYIPKDAEIRISPTAPIALVTSHEDSGVTAFRYLTISNNNFQDPVIRNGTYNPFGFDSNNNAIWGTSNGPDLQFYISGIDLNFIPVPKRPIAITPPKPASQTFVVDHGFLSLKQDPTKKISIRAPEGSSFQSLKPVGSTPDQILIWFNNDLRIVNIDKVKTSDVIAANEQLQKQKQCEEFANIIKDALQKLDETEGLPSPDKLIERLKQLVSDPSVLQHFTVNYSDPKDGLPWVGYVEFGGFRYYVAPGLIGG